MSRQLIDLTGKKFGRLTVLSRAANNKSGRTQWLCQCECGKQKTVLAQNLINGRTQSCGSQTQIRDLTGRRFGRLTVLSHAVNDQHGHALWLCQCDCGKQKTVRGLSLVNGHTKSCGCIKRGPKNS